MLKVFFNIVTKIQLLRLERCNMIEGYTILIMNGLATIDRVPVRHKESVLDNLTNLGLDGYGNQLQPIEQTQSND